MPFITYVETSEHILSLSLSLSLSLALCIYKAEQEKIQKLQAVQKQRAEAAEDEEATIQQFYDKNRMYGDGYIQQCFLSDLTVYDAALENTQYVQDEVPLSLLALLVQK